MTERADVLILSVKLQNGSFETSLRVPVPCTVEKGRIAMEQWLEFAMTGLRIGALEMTAGLGEKP